MWFDTPAESEKKKQRPDSFDDDDDDWLEQLSPFEENDLIVNDGDWLQDLSPLDEEDLKFVKNTPINQTVFVMFIKNPKTEKFGFVGHSFYVVLTEYNSVNIDNFDAFVLTDEGKKIKNHKLVRSWLQMLSKTYPDKSVIVYEISENDTYLLEKDEYKYPKIKLDSSKEMVDWKFSFPAFDQILRNKYICTVYNDNIFCFGGPDRLLSRSVLKDEWEKIATFQMIMQNPEYKVFFRDVHSVLNFEIRKNYMFICILKKTPIRSLYICILDANKNIHYKNILKYAHAARERRHRMGLIGDIGCYTTEQNNEIEIKTSSLTIKMPNTKIRVCYNTPSNCFLATNPAGDSYVWKVLTKTGIQDVLNPAVAKPFNLSKGLIYTLNENYWVWFYKPTLSSVDKNGYYQTMRFDLDVKDICIVDDFAYMLVVSGSNTWIYIVNLKNNTVKKAQNVKQTNPPPNYIRVHSSGFMLGYYDPTTRPIFFTGLGGGFKSVDCQICQVTSRFMCSECGLPACSYKHFRCCKIKK